MVALDEVFGMRLRTIADRLGVPVEWFFGDAPSGGLVDGSELLRLWLRLETEEHRTAALAYLRDLAGE